MFSYHFSFTLGYITEINHLPVSDLLFKLSANESFFTVGNLECQYNSTAVEENIAKERILKACILVNQPVVERANTTLRPTVKRKVTKSDLRTDFAFNKPTVIPTVVPPLVHVQKVVEPTSRIVEGLKSSVNVTMTINVVVALCVTVGVIAILAFVYFMYRLYIRRLEARSRHPDAEVDEYEESQWTCFSPSSSSRYASNQKTTYVHYNVTQTPHTHVEDIDEDELDGLQGHSRRRGDLINNTLHMELNYKRRKKKFGVLW